MRLRHMQLEEESPINMTPMIDMVFLLLIFFLLATTFAQAERKTEREKPVQLPATDSPVPLSAAPANVVINITADGKIIVGGKPYSTDQLQAMLSEMSEERNVLIRADERSIHRYFADVADICYKAGITELRIGYVPRSIKLSSDQ